MAPSPQPLPLLCGHCPTRRVLGHIRVFTDRGAPVVMASTGRRQWRPKQAQPVTWQPVVEGAPLRVLCKGRHQWDRTHAEVLGAYRDVVDKGRRTITLGVDL